MVPILRRTSHIDYRDIFGQHPDKLSILEDLREGCVRVTTPISVLPGVAQVFAPDPGPIRLRGRRKLSRLV